MNGKDCLGDRMKVYEQAARSYLPRRMPVIIRVDGKAFHSYCHSFRRPFDDRMMSLMDATAMELCEHIQGAQLAYVQSDEISVLVHNYKRLNTDAWFDNAVQKMCSVAAGIASGAFSGAATRMALPYASFDARVFVLPEAEVCNYFIWRQQDATRNSIQMLARSLYSHKECHLKSCAELQDMIHAKGRNWDKFATECKRGRCAVRKEQLVDTPRASDGVIRTHWVMDNEIPIFTQDRSYIERCLTVENESEAE